MRKSWRIILGVTALAIVIYILSKINFVEVYNVLTTINLGYFLLAIAAYSLSVLVFSLRGMISLSGMIKEHDFWFFLKNTLAGFFVNVITPGAQVGGEPIRAYFFGEKYKKPKTTIFGAVLADRLFHGVVSLFFIIASLLFVLTYIPVSRELKIIFQTALFFILGVLALIIFLNIKKTGFSLEKILKKLGILKNVSGNKHIRHLSIHFGNFTRSFRKVFFSKKTLFLGILFSFICWILIYLSSYFLFLSLGIHISFFIVIIVISIGSLIGDFSPTPGGVGLVEGSMVFLYTVLGINLSAAITVAFLSRLMYYFFSLVLGGISVFYLEKSLG